MALLSDTDRVVAWMSGIVPPDSKVD